MIYIIILLLISAFFSASETGFTGVIRARIHKLKIEGNRRAIMVANLRKDKERLIGTILLGNTAVNILASVLATEFSDKHFSFGERNAFFVTIIMTLLIVIFSEVLPKAYALRNADKVALTVAPLYIFIVKIFSPLTALVHIIVNFFLWIFGSKKGDTVGVQGIDLLRGAIEMHHDEGAVVKHDRDMLGSILDLSDTEVWEIMVHRKDMVTLNIDQPNNKIIEQILEELHSRVPVWRDNPDNIIGVLYNKDLVRSIQHAGNDVSKIDIKSLLKEPWFIPETTTLRDQLHKFRRKHNHFALVVDEYGALLGLVTLEDILEEIVGQIDDEYDSRVKRMKKQEDGSYIIDGRVSIRDINRELDWNLPDEEGASTIAGLVINDAQIIPETGQKFHFHGYRFEIVKKRRNQIAKLRVKKLEKE